MSFGQTFRAAFAVVLVFAVGSWVNADLVINEIRVDQPAADNDEYFELFADGMNFDLSTFTYIVIGDGAGGSGVLESVTGLSGTLNAGEFLLVAESSFTQGTADVTASLNFENSDNVTHLLVEGYDGTALQTDLDTDDDGVLDVTPWTSVIDSIALLEEVGAGDLVYSPNTIGPDGTFVPAHVFRDIDGTSGTFQIGNFGDFDLDTPGSSNVAIPEPSSFAILAAAGLIAVRRRR